MEAKKKLKGQSKASFMEGNNMRRKIFSLCHELGWTKSDKGKQVVDQKRLNAFLEKRGYLHKPLNFYTPKELPTLVTQFENMLTKQLVK